MQGSVLLLCGSLAWAIVLWAIVARRRLELGAGVGLSGLYLLLLAVIHLPGALAHALPWFWRRDAAFTAAGFGPAVLGMLCYGAGVLALEPALAGLRRPASSPHLPAPRPPDVLLALPGGEALDAPPGVPFPARGWAGDEAPSGAYALAPGPALVPGPGGGMPEPLRPTVPSMAWPLSLLGLLGLLVLTPLTVGVPTVRSIAANLGQLLNIGLGLACWQAWREGRRGGLWRWLLAACCLPLLTVVFGGFLGFGSFALLSVVMLAVSFVRIRPSWAPLALLAVYLGLSVFVTYMRDRQSIRAAVWGGEELGARTDLLATTLGSLELFDPWSQPHLNAIDDRLNQNTLVSLAVSYLDAGYTEFARGETFVQAVEAMVPRALWPTKPYIAGGSGLVSRFTGVEFGASTSVGIGQVLEFYVNFGLAGVGLGFLALGALIASFDRRAARALRGGDQLGFSFWYLPGLALMLPGNSLAEMAATLGAAFVTALLLSVALPSALRLLAPGAPR